MAVINPNRRDCTYPEKNLCGAGVAFKLTQALMRGLGGLVSGFVKSRDSYVKMIAVATVADVVPLLGENRVIVNARFEASTRFAIRSARVTQSGGFQSRRAPKRRPDRVSPSRRESTRLDGWRTRPTSSKCF